MRIPLSLNGLGSSFLEFEELKNKADQAIEQLPEELKSVFKMNRFDAMKYREIAEKLQISEKTVEARMIVAHEPWPHLISTGPNRYQEFPFTGGDDLKWVSYIHIEDNVAMDAEKIKLYEPYPCMCFSAKTGTNRPKPPTGKTGLKIRAGTMPNREMWTATSIWFQKCGTPMARFTTSITEGTS